MSVWWCLDLQTFWNRVLFSLHLVLTNKLPFTLSTGVAAIYIGSGAPRKGGVSGKTMSSTTDAGGSGVSNQLSSLVPTFDPATDDLLIYQQKVELVVAAWPKGKLPELITRLILGAKARHSKSCRYIRVSFSEEMKVVSRN